jgi:symplekin
MAGPTGIDDEEEYDPEYELSADAVTTPATAQVLEELAQPAIDLGPFELPIPPPLTGAEVSILSQQTVSRVFELVTTLDTTGDSVSRQKLGLNRLAAAHNDRDAWVTMMTRLATRAPTSLNSVSDIISDDQEHPLNPDAPTVANTIRQTLYMYILDSFRPRLNIAISWLTEEWYADKLSSSPTLPNYTHWTLKLLDSLLPYLDARDAKLLVRFLSEIPAITPEILDRVQSLARDPERVGLCLMGLQYLIMFRPPVREMAVDTVERIWRDDAFIEARAQARKVLGKWRPGVLVVKADEEVVKVNGNANATDVPDTNGNWVQKQEVETQMPNPTPTPEPATSAVSTPKEEINITTDLRKLKSSPHSHPLSAEVEADAG